MSVESKKHLITVTLETSTLREDGTRKRDTYKIVEEGADGTAEYITKVKAIRDSLQVAEDTVVTAMETMAMEGLAQGIEPEDVDWTNPGQSKKESSRKR